MCITLQSQSNDTDLGLGPLSGQSGRYLVKSWKRLGSREEEDVPHKVRYDDLSADKGLQFEASATAAAINGAKEKTRLGSVNRGQ